MVLWRDETESEAAFKQRLEELGVKAKYTKIDAGQDRAKLAEAMRGIEADIAAKKFDLIYTYGTTVTQVAQSVVNNSTPIVFTIVFDPVGGKLVKSMEEPGVNATGVTNGVPINDQFDAIQKVSPIQNLCMVFDARVPNSNLVERQVNDWAKAHSVPMTSLRVAPGNDSLDRALDDIKTDKVKCDVVYAGADSYIASEATKIRDAVGDKVKLFGGTETFILRGWLGAYATRVQDMGATAADLGAKILAGGDASKIPVVLPQPHMFLTEASATKFGITVPGDAIKR
ncbi:ABC transporter substrate binding protein [Indioceanicola profundi]|uniref:ABC transporter substrate binding protein n=1 Tax=Indioceanicola profundi TaxID=2220096 RepID=UPI0013C4C294|nr:ABC transporter substrate binding protein [Indioceanicola profundi]